jgi:hypothetical protein
VKRINRLQQKQIMGEVQNCQEGIKYEVMKKE